MIGSVKARFSNDVLPMIVKPLLLLVSSLLLGACASTPQPLIINLAPIANPSPLPVQQLSVSDQRPHSYLYRQLKDDDKAQFIAPSMPLATTIKTALRPSVNNNSNGPTWSVTIQEAVVEGTQRALKYQLTHQVELRVTAVNNNRRYSNVYRGRATSTGIGRASPAVIEREFSALLEQVLRDISADPELRISREE